MHQGRFLFAQLTDFIPRHLDTSLIYALSDIRVITVFVTYLAGITFSLSSLASSPNAPVSATQLSASTPIKINSITLAFAQNIWSLPLSPVPVKKEIGVSTVISRRSSSTKPAVFT